MDAIKSTRSATLRDRRSRVVWLGVGVVATALVLIGVLRPNVTRATLVTAMAEPRDRQPLALDRIKAEHRLALSTPAGVAPKKVPRFASFAEPRTVETKAGKVMLLPTSRGTSSASNPPKVVTMLHGMCSTVEWSCEAVKDAMPDGYVLACPTGNRACGDDAADWGGEAPERAAHVAKGVDEAVATLDIGKDRGQTDVLMGFSRGAFVARDIAYVSPHRYRALVLIGGAMMPSAKLLKESGIQKVVLASGDYDGAQKTMRSAHGMLLASGIPTRFVSLGRVWHTLPPDTSARLREALAWAVTE